VAGVVGGSFEIGDANTLSLASAVEHGISLKIIAPGARGIDAPRFEGCEPRVRRARVHQGVIVRLEARGLRHRIEEQARDIGRTANNDEIALSGATVPMPRLAINVYGAVLTSSMTYLIGAPALIA
jgi:hypothetical protein